MSLELTGKVKMLLEKQTFSSGFEKREFVKIGETDRQFLNEGVYLEATIYEKWVLYKSRR